MAYLILALEILGNSSLYLIGSRKSQGKLELGWKILVDIKLPQIIFTKQMFEAFPPAIPVLNLYTQKATYHETL